ICSVLAVTTLSLASCGNDSDTAENEAGIKSVTFAVADPALAVSTAVYTSVPTKLGYFEDNGLDVEIEPLKDAGATAQAVGAGNAFITESGVSTMYPAMLKDSNLQILAYTG